MRTAARSRAVGGMLDVTQQHRDEADLRLLRRAVEATDNGIVDLPMRAQPDMPMVYVNPAFEQHHRLHAPPKCSGRNCRFLQGDDRDQLGARRDPPRPCAEEREARALLRNYRKDGDAVLERVPRRAGARRRTARSTHFVGVQNDVTERQRYEEQLAYRATHDELTGLPNRQLLLDRLQQAIAQRRALRPRGRAWCSSTWTTSS